MTFYIDRLSRRFEILRNIGCKQISYVYLWFCGEHFLRENPVWRVCGILRDFSANILGDACEKIKAAE